MTALKLILKIVIAPVILLLTLAILASGRNSPQGPGRKS